MDFCYQIPLPDITTLALGVFMLCLPVDLLKVGQYVLSFTPLAKLFMLKECIEHEEDCPLLSCADIETLLAHVLPRRDNGVDEVIRQMEERHRKRQASIDFAYAKQRACADL